MRDRVKNRQIVGAEFECAVDLAVGIESRVPAIRRNLVVQVRFRVRPVPLGNHDVALDAAWARRRRRELSGGDAIGPVGEYSQRASNAETLQAASHAAASLPRKDAALPSGH